MDIKNQDTDYQLNLKRGWSLVVYDMQGGPIPTKALDRLEAFAQQVAKEFNLAVTSTVE